MVFPKPRSLPATAAAAGRGCASQGAGFEVEGQGVRVWGVERSCPCWVWSHKLWAPPVRLATPWRQQQRLLTAANPDFRVRNPSAVPQTPKTSAQVGFWNVAVACHAPRRVGPKWPPMPHRVDCQPLVPFCRLPNLAVGACAAVNDDCATSVPAHLQILDVLVHRPEIQALAVVLERRLDDE